MAGLTKKGTTYYALFSVNGKTKWVKIGKVSYPKAKAALKQLESDFEMNRIGFIDTKPPESFDRFSIRYLNYSKANKAY